MRRLRPLLLLAVAALPACRPTQATLAAPDQRQRLYVAPYTRTCTGMYEMQCMLVRESPGEEWSNFYQPIEGFEWEPGYRYELVVGWREIADPPADGASRVYWLVELVRKERVEAGEG